MSQQISYVPISSDRTTEEISLGQEEDDLNLGNTANDNVSLRPISQATELLLNNDKLGSCGSRQDSSGVWNILQACWLFIAHPIACVLFVVLMMQLVHGRNFQPGTPPGSIFNVSVPLFQTQVTGLVSLGLVLVRILSACCTAPLIWTMIVILLEKRGMTLSEISRVNDFRIPILPRFKTTAQYLWSIWATLVITLIWPSNFASPLANSSLAWNPKARDLRPPTQYSMKISPMDSNDFWQLRAPEWQMRAFLESVIRSGTSPEYAFRLQDEVPLRRYFSRPPGMTNNSTMDLTLPYIDVQVRWIDASSNNLSTVVVDTAYSDYVGGRQNGVNRMDGSIVIMMDEPWDQENDYPKEATKFIEERVIAVKYNTWDSDDGLSSCPRTSKYFQNMPGLEPHHQTYSVDAKSWGGDCYQIGIATLRAGLFQGVDCDITLIGSTDAAATCNTTRDFTAIKEDWVAPVATKMLSEITKGFITLGSTIPWQNYPIDSYVSSVLMLSYHAAWSSAIDLMQIKENTTFRQATFMVQASVDKGRLFGWLAMNLTVTLAAGLVFIALQFAKTKLIQDTTLAMLQLDMSQITHHRLALGLCDAATLSKRDHRLPMVKLQRNPTGSLLESTRKEPKFCQKRLVFVDEKGQQID